MMESLRVVTAMKRRAPPKVAQCTSTFRAAWDRHNRTGGCSGWTGGCFGWTGFALDRKGADRVDETIQSDTCAYPP